MAASPMSPRTMLARRISAAGRSKAFAMASSTVFSFRPIRRSPVMILMTYFASRAEEIQYERELVGSSGQFDEVGQPGLNGGWTERAALRARQQLLGKLAEIAMSEID